MKINQFSQIAAAFCLILSWNPGIADLNAQTIKPKTMEQIIIKSPAFPQNEMIPSKYTCDGENISPTLDWSDLPAETKSIALIIDDPDAPSGDWVHFVLFNIPPDTRHLNENFNPVNKPKPEIRAGKNSRGTLDYHGPCPPSGTHRYFFKLYALDIVLKQAEGISKQDLLKAIEGHVIAKGELIGLYKKLK